MTLNKRYTQSQNLYAGHNCILRCNIWINFTQLLSVTQRVVLTSTKGHIVKVTVHTTKSVSRPQLHAAMLDLDISHICCPWPRMCHVLEPMSYIHSRSQCACSQNSCLGRNFSMVTRSRAGWTKCGKISPPNSNLPSTSGKRKQQNISKTKKTIQTRQRSKRLYRRWIQ